MKRFLLALVAIVSLGIAAAYGNYTATQGAGTTFGSIVVSTVHYAQQLICDVTTPSQCAAVSVGGAVSVADSAVLAAVNSSIPAGTNVIGALSANQSVNEAQINGVTPLMGNGVSGTGSQRMNVANDNSAIPGWGHGATGAAPPSGAVYGGGNGSGATGGFLRGNIICDQHAFYDASDNGLKTVVAGVSGRKTYVCGYILGTAGTATTLGLTSGTGSDCVSTSTKITPAYVLLANDKIGANSPFWNGLITLANADNLCVNASAGNSHQVEIWYAIL